MITPRLSRILCPSKVEIKLLCLNQRMRVRSVDTTLAANSSFPAARVDQLAAHFTSSSSHNYPSNTKATTKDKTMASNYTVRKIGAPNTLEHRIYIEKDGVPVSPFHDIPLYANEQQTILNMVVEIPRWTNG